VTGGPQPQPYRLAGNQIGRSVLEPALRFGIATGTTFT
jgi:hypothetical protein